MRDERIALALLSSSVIVTVPIDGTTTAVPITVERIWPPFHASWNTVKSSSPVQTPGACRPTSLKLVPGAGVLTFKVPSKMRSAPLCA